LQLTYLVLHQCDQRRNDEAHASLHQGGKLVAQRFAASGGHERENVAALEHILHHGLLAGTEGVEAEGSPQGMRYVRSHGAHSSGP